LEAGRNGTDRSCKVFEVIVYYISPLGPDYLKRLLAREDSCTREFVLFILSTEALESS